MDLETKRLIAEEKSRRRTMKYRTKDDRCGTVAGYFAHRRRKPKERPCKECRDAWATYRRSEREKKRTNA